MISDMDPALFLAPYPENQNENYCHETIKRIREGGTKKWLCSLPMYEYAYTLVMACAMRNGGDIEPYITDLYETRMNPILKQYYDKLMHYRFRRAILMRANASLQKLVEGSSVSEELADMQHYATQTRRALRGVVRDFIEERNDPTKTPRPLEQTLQEAYPWAP